MNLNEQTINWYVTKWIEYYSCQTRVLLYGQSLPKKSTTIRIKALVYFFFVAGTWVHSLALPIISYGRPGRWYDNFIQQSIQRGLISIPRVTISEFIEVYQKSNIRPMGRHSNKKCLLYWLVTGNSCMRRVVTQNRTTIFWCGQGCDVGLGGQNVHVMKRYGGLG